MLLWKFRFIEKNRGGTSGPWLLPFEKTRLDQFVRVHLYEYCMRIVNAYIYIHMYVHVYLLIHGDDGTDDDDNDDNDAPGDGIDVDTNENENHEL